MLRKIINSGPKGQTLIEYTVVVGVVIMVIMAMGTMIKRSTQGMVKSMADQIGNQLNADQVVEPESSHLEASYTAARMKMDKTRQERLGYFNYVHDDLTEIVSNAYVNLGYTEVNN